LSTNATVYIMHDVQCIDTKNKEWDKMTHLRS